MPTAQTQTEALHVLANLALLDREHLVLVSKDTAPYLLIKILGVILFLNLHCILYNLQM